MLAHVAVGDVDAVLVTHGHPDHCADLHPLLRARALSGGGQALPLHSPAGALDAILALDGPAMLDGAFVTHDLPIPGRVQIGPLTVDTMLMPHFLPNAGIRVSAGGTSFAYTGDSGPHEPFTAFAADVDLLIAEATYATEMPPNRVGMLNTAIGAAELAARSGAHTLWLTHLWPGSDPTAHLAAATSAWPGPVEITTPHLTWPA
ncbi:MBL fold metallo-hydrolase [Paractinoplanes durhamensis]|uniref:MBL fold metallo-hydrolase n=1 Tax=Paractinoplanes durhamensis TaxID=113563 RepID=A0ABQ3Z0L4_9ACTN|nr:MBL fold metallo-hydrolase [Actinoplanes durhamensis]